jgi:hypothetical protein
MLTDESSEKCLSLQRFPYQLEEAKGWSTLELMRDTWNREIKGRSGINAWNGGTTLELKVILPHLGVE